MKILDDLALKEILAELASSAYFFQKEKAKVIKKEEEQLYEEDGSIIATFTSGIIQVNPGEEDSFGKIWNPPLVDKDGNPLLDRDGKPKKAWIKYEIKAIIKEKELIYGISGGSRGGCFRGIGMEMIKNGIVSKDLPGTQWKIKNLGNYKWDISYLGKVELPKETKKPNGVTKKPNGISVKDNVLKAIEMVKEKAPFSQKLAGIGKADFVNAVSFFAELDEKKVILLWQEILNAGIIKEENGKVFFL